MSKSLRLYIAAWLIYMGFSLLGFPYLNITVMLFSIPLTMLGGWFFNYRGAVLTIILTIPYHYLLLSIHSNEHALLSEAFNPFGVGTQLFFSMSTAFIKTIDTRYQKLNDQLESIIEERTNDLRQLTDYLINMDYIDQSLSTSGLLDNPIHLLKNMQPAATLLCRSLEEQAHPQLSSAKTIDKYIRECLEQLTEFVDVSPSVTDSETTLRKQIEKLSKTMSHLSGDRLDITIEGEWENLETAAGKQVHDIISEAVTNAIRHANATEIRIGCKCEETGLLFYVENNGKAFPSRMNEGMGLPLMRYRAMSIGGLLSISGGVGKKTRLLCTIPRKATMNEKTSTHAGQEINTLP